MRLCEIRNFGRSAEFYEPRKHVRGKAIVYSCDKLSVRKRPCSACTELNVRFCVENSFTIKQVNRLFSLFNGTASFKHGWLIAKLGEQQCRKKSRRSCTYHDGRCAHNLVTDYRYGALNIYFGKTYCVQLFSYLFRNRCADRYGINDFDIVLFSCVNAFFINSVLETAVINSRDSYFFTCNRKRLCRRGVRR